MKADIAGSILHEARPSRAVRYGLALLCLLFVVLIVWAITQQYHEWSVGLIAKATLAACFYSYAITVGLFTYIRLCENGIEQKRLFRVAEFYPYVDVKSFCEPWNGGVRIELHNGKKLKTHRFFEGNPKEILKILDQRCLPSVKA